MEELTDRSGPYILCDQYFLDSQRKCIVRHFSNLDPFSSLNGFDFFNSFVMEPKSGNTWFAVVNEKLTKLTTKCVYDKIKSLADSITFHDVSGLWVELANDFTPEIKQTLELKQDTVKQFVVDLNEFLENLRKEVVYEVKRHTYANSANLSFIWLRVQ